MYCGVGLQSIEHLPSFLLTEETVITDLIKLDEGRAHP